MKRKLSAPLLLGLVLVVAALSIGAFFGIRMALGNRKCQTAVTKLETLLPQRTRGVPGTYTQTDMPVLEIDGTDYVALLQVPDFNVKLPVSDAWDQKNLYATPSRFSGSAYDGTLVIGGGNDLQKFSFCNQIDIGATVIITDMTGAEFTYSVATVDRAKHAESQWLSQDGYDLTLFCQDVMSLEYIAVRCVSNSIKIPDAN